MAPSDASPPNTAIEFARAAYLRQPELVEFLLAENLALKSLLFEKGLLTPEEFKAHKERAVATLRAKMDEHIAGVVVKKSPSERRQEQTQEQVLERLKALLGPSDAPR